MELDGGWCGAQWACRGAPATLGWVWVRPARMVQRIALCGAVMQMIRGKGGGGVCGVWPACRCTKGERRLLTLDVACAWEDDGRRFLLVPLLLWYEGFIDEDCLWFERMRDGI